MASPPRERPGSRRPHTKTRSGCVICKRRRVKCDEGRPRCANCTLADRPCAYSSHPDLISPVGQPPTAAAWTATGRSPSRSDASPLDAPGGQGPAAFTLLHMTLLHHAHGHNGEFLGIRRDCRPLVDLVVESAPSAPYALDQLLALSALHCSVISATPGQAKDSPDHTRNWNHRDYARHATELQGRALASFNDARSQITGPNHLPAFVFAVLLGHQLLHTTLTALPSQTFTDFLPSFVHYVRVHRGVRSVTGLHWAKILDSKLSPLLSFVDQMPPPGTLSTGPETEAVRRAIQRGVATTAGSPLEVASGDDDQGGNLPFESPCLEALQWAQWVVDLTERQSNAGTERDACDHGHNDQGQDRARQQPSEIMVHAVVTWPLVVPQAYVEALYQHRLEALLVLAFYAAGLHRCRGFWVFGGDKDAGYVLVQMIRRHVGPAWDACLAWPMKVIMEE